MASLIELFVSAFVELFQLKKFAVNCLIEMFAVHRLLHTLLSMLSIQWLS